MNYSTKKSTIKKILLTDNDFTRRDVHSQLLQKAGYCVELADNGAQMLAKLLTAHHYSLIAIDVSLANSILPLIQSILEKKLARRDSIVILIPFNLSRGLAEAFERIGIDSIVRRSWLYDYVSRWLESIEDKSTNLITSDA